MSVFRNFYNWYFSRNALPYWYILAIDSMIVLVSGYLAFFLQLRSGAFVANFWQVTRCVMLCLIPFIAFFRVFHTYTGIVRYSSFVDLKRIAYASVCATAVIAIASFLLSGIDGILLPNFVGGSVLLVLSTLLILMVRVSVKLLFDNYRRSKNSQKAFIYGIKEGGVSLAKSIINQSPQQYVLSGFVSPEGDIKTKFLMGVKVHRDGPNLVKHMQDTGVRVMLVSPLQSDNFRQREELINQLTEANIKIMMMPSAEEWNGKTSLSHSQLREVEIEDLLPRDKIEVDMDAIGKMLSGHCVLITGAAGSIGSEMVRQIAPYGPSNMVLVDQAETPMHNVRLMMARRFPNVMCETVVASITDKSHMEKLFSTYHPEYVFHAAAYKHVPMMEDNPEQAVRNNVNGTRIIADLAVKYGTRKFVMISTDKAVNPTNVMGCSKRICEIYCQSLNKAIQDGEVKGVTQFVTTRFGNVLGSNGSVIPLFKEQIRRGGPVTVTHPDIIRFFMLIPEACKLVLEAGTMGKGGEIFVFDMGKPVKIVDLAARMIALSGARNVEIKFSGLRDGEKLYEEVLNDAEGTKPTHHPKIMIAKVRENDYETARRNEDELLQISYTHDDMAIVRKMKEIVPEFKSKHSKYEALD